MGRDMMQAPGNADVLHLNPVLERFALAMPMAARIHVYIVTHVKKLVLWYQPLGVVNGGPLSKKSWCSFPIKVWCVLLHLRKDV